MRFNNIVKQQRRAAAAACSTTRRSKHQHRDCLTPASHAPEPYSAPLSRPLAQANTLLLSSARTAAEATSAALCSTPQSLLPHSHCCCSCSHPSLLQLPPRPLHTPLHCCTCKCQLRCHCQSSHLHVLLLHVLLHRGCHVWHGRELEALQQPLLRSKLLLHRSAGAYLYPLSLPQAKSPYRCPDPSLQLISSRLRAFNVLRVHRTSSSV